MRSSSWRKGEKRGRCNDQLKLCACILNVQSDRRLSARRRPLEEVAEEVEKQRAVLMAQNDNASAQEAQKKLTGETHELAQRKLDQMDKLKTALGISAVKEGDAFNRDLQVRGKDGDRQGV